MSEEEVTEEQPVEKAKSASELLIEAREKAELSQKEVADKLFLTATFIKYIDSGEFDRIPKPAFIRGYLRSYARVVELSGDMIVELYDAELQLAEPAPEMKGVTEEKIGTAHITGPVLQTGLIGFALLAVVIGLIWWLVSESNEEQPIQVRQPTITVPETPSEDVQAFDYVIGSADEPDAGGGTSAQMQFDENEPEGLISSSDPLPADEPVEQTADEVAGEPEAEPEEEQSAGQTPAEPQAAEAEPPLDEISIERLRDGDRSYINVDAGGFDELTLTFTDECWVEISDGQFGLVYHDLNRDNDVLTVYATLPFRVLLGKATGVEMLYNGAPFDLEPFIGPDNTAKITISE